MLGRLAWLLQNVKNKKPAVLSPSTDSSNSNVSNSQGKKITKNAFPGRPQIINIMHLANKCITPCS